MMEKRRRVDLIDVRCPAAESLLKEIQPEVISNIQKGIHAENIDLRIRLFQHFVYDGDHMVNVVKLSDQKSDHLDIPTTLPPSPTPSPSSL